MWDKIFKVLFWLNVLVFTCCGCHWCGSDFNKGIFMGVDLKERTVCVKPLSKCDMTIEDESGFRQRFICDSEETFRVDAINYVTQKWKSKSLEMKTALLKELTGILLRFSVNGKSAFLIGGLKICPTSYFMAGGERARY